MQHHEDLHIPHATATPQGTMEILLPSKASRKFQLGRLAVDLSVHAERSAPSTNKRDLFSGRAVAETDRANQ